MNWRTILNTNLETEPLAHNTHNTQNPTPEGNCADCADIAYRGANSKPDLMAELEHHHDAQQTSCATCHHRTRMKSCGVPVQAGLSEQFAIRWHEQDGKDCPAWRPCE